MAMLAVNIMMLSTNHATNRVPSPAGSYATWMFSGVSNVRLRSWWFDYEQFHLAEHAGLERAGSPRAEGTQVAPPHPRRAQPSGRALPADDRAPLSQVATRTTDTRLIAYLNDLTAAAHSLIYLPPRKSAWQGAGRFAVEGFARLIARNWRHHVGLGGPLDRRSAGRLFRLDARPVAAYALMPRGEERSPGSTPEYRLAS